MSKKNRKKGKPTILQTNRTKLPLNHAEGTSDQLKSAQNPPIIRLNPDLIYEMKETSIDNAEPTLLQKLQDLKKELRDEIYHFHQTNDEFRRMNYAGEILQKKAWLGRYFLKSELIYPLQDQERLLIDEIKDIISGIEVDEQYQQSKKRLEDFRSRSMRDDKEQ